VYCIESSSDIAHKEDVRRYGGPTAHLLFMRRYRVSVNFFGPFELMVICLGVSPYVEKLLKDNIISLRKFLRIDIYIFSLKLEVQIFL
jgi:hypothetical protein